MKKVLFGTFIAAAALVACKNGENTENAKIAELQHWVDSVKNITNTTYSDSAWTAIQGMVDSKMGAIDTAKLDEAGKTSMTALKTSFEAYKATYVAGIDKAKADAAMMMHNDSMAMDTNKAMMGEDKTKMEKVIEKSKEVVKEIKK